MSTYTNIKCGACGYSFTDGYTPGGRQSSLGPSKILCKKCLSVNTTSQRPYSQFTSYDRFTFWVGRTLMAIVRGGLWVGAAVFGILLLFDLESEAFIVGSIIIGMIGNVILIYFLIPEEIKETEKAEAEFPTSEIDLKIEKFRHTLEKLNQVGTRDTLTQISLLKTPARAEAPSISTSVNANPVRFNSPIQISVTLDNCTSSSGNISMPKLQGLIFSKGPSQIHNTNWVNGKKTSNHVYTYAYLISSHQDIKIPSIKLSTSAGILYSKPFVIRVLNDETNV